MYGFNGFDINGKSCFVDEQGHDIGVVHSDKGVIQAIRLDPSVYMDTDGKIYAAFQKNCTKYATTEWFDWARRKMLSLGYKPNF